MGEAVGRSSRPSGADANGGFHEEGGEFGLDSDGHQISVAAAPGPFADPRTTNATIETGNPANPADVGRIEKVQGTFHVHPKGEIVVGPKTTPGVVVIGGPILTANFNQKPSMPDLNLAMQAPSNTNFVLGARTSRVYIYNSNGELTPNGIPLKNFLKIGSK